MEIRDTALLVLCIAVCLLLVIGFILFGWVLPAFERWLRKRAEREIRWRVRIEEDERAEIAAERQQ